MANPATIDVKDILVAANLGIFATDLFIGKLPATPINVTCLFDSSSGQSFHRNNLDNENLHIRVRNTTYEAGYKIINDIRRFLQSKKSVTINDSDYIGFWSSSNVFSMGMDKNENYTWAYNLKIIRSTTDNDNGEGS